MDKIQTNAHIYTLWIHFHAAISLHGRNNSPSYQYQLQGSKSSEKNIKITI